MLLNSGYDASAYDVYNTVETLLEDVSKQMAASNLTRRFSQGSRPRAGGSMRVVKTASNSPRNSAGVPRRKTVMTDSPYRQSRLAVDHHTITGQGTDLYQNDCQENSRSSRPMSWHPSSHLPQSGYQSTQHVPRLELNEAYNTCPQSHTPAVYSSYASPTSGFSPPTQPFNSYDQQQYPFFQDNSALMHTTFEPIQNAYAPYQPSALCQTPMADPNTIYYNQYDWSTFPINTFHPDTAPPTPENFMPMQHQEALFQAEESIPYHSLEDEEPVGEVLVGMGLYDTPEKTPPSDPQFENYRALMMTQLLGSAYRKHEPTGKGLKLEETWNPPSDEEDEEEEEEEGEDGEDDDAEGSTVDDTLPEESNLSSITSSFIPLYNHQGLPEAANMASQSGQPPQYLANNRSGWL